jgi:hypothetical protein
MDFFLTPFSATGAIGYSFFIFHILSVSSTGESLQRRLMEECLHKQSRKVVISNGVWQAIRSFPFGLSEDKSPSPNIWPIISLAVLSLKPSLMMFRRQWSSCIHAILLWTGGLSTDLADYLWSVSGIQRPVMLSTDLCWFSINRVREHRRPHCLRIRGRVCLRQGYRICNLSAACLEQIGWKTFFFDGLSSEWL